MVAVHKVTLFAMRIKPTKAVTSLWMNIKPTKPTISTLKAHQIYRVSRNLQARYSLPDRLVATIIELLELFLQK